jgi:arylsulfatase A-like enzyme
MYSPDEMAAPVRAPSAAQEAEQHPLLDFYLRKTTNASFFQGAEGYAAELSEDEIKQMRATYFGMMTEIDDCLGKVFAELDAQGKWDDTLIIFTSDHGEQLGDHHLLGKVGYFDESFRIPLIVKDPRRKDRAGEIEDCFTESVDVMPTIIDWLDGTVPHTCDGRSLLPILEGKKPDDWRTELHYEYDYRDIHYSQPEAFLGVGMDDAGLCVIQDENYKYVHFTSLPPLFFDLKKDPHQFANLAEDPAYASLIKTYAQKMLSWRMKHADRTLTAYRTTPRGLENRAATSATTVSQKDI